MCRFTHPRQVVTGQRRGLSLHLRSISDVLFSLAYALVRLVLEVLIVHGRVRWAPRRGLGRPPPGSSAGTPGWPNPLARYTVADRAGPAPVPARDAKAARVYAALLRDGWGCSPASGAAPHAHKDERTPAFAHHDAHELGGVQLAQLARGAGYTMDELSHSVRRRDP